MASSNKQVIKKTQRKPTQKSKTKNNVVAKKTKKTASRNKTLLNIKNVTAGLAVIVVFSIAFSFINTQTVTTNKSLIDSNKSKMILETSSESIKSGDEFTVKVYSDSESVDVNAVQAAITYTPEVVELLEINSTDSQYPVNAYESRNNGEIEVVRGVVTGINEKKLVSELKFIAKASGNANIKFDDTMTLLISSNTNANILDNDSFNNITIKVN